MSASKPQPARTAQRRRRATIRYVAASATEIPAGARKIVTLGGRSIGVFNVAGVYYAVRNRCPHQGGPLCLGALTNLTRPRFHVDRPPEVDFDPDRKLIRCPWHAWEFDLRDGEAVFDAGVHVATYRAYVQDHPDVDPDARYSEGVEVPPPVETYRTTVESGYVVVEVGI